MTKMPHLQSMIWTVNDELQQVTLNASGDTAYYVYDTEGNRARKVIERGNVKEERFYLGDYEIYRTFTNETLNLERSTVHIMDDRDRIAMIDRETGGDTVIRYQLADHLGSSSIELDDKANIISYEEYHPFGTTSYQKHNTNISQKRYKYTGKERDNETGMYYYGARYYAAWTCRFVSVDPLAGKYLEWSPYVYCADNPIKYIDPDGRMAVSPSTDVTKNEDGSYTVVNAHNDGDNNIYVVDGDGNRTGEVIGTTMKPYDFMSTNDQTGEFTFNKNMSGVSFSLDDLTVSSTVKPNKHTESAIYNADAQRLLDWGMGLFNDEVKRQSPATFYGSLEILKEMSANGAALDFKVSLGLPKYTAIKAGNTSDGKPIITTLRAMGNMTFGANMRSTKPYLLGSPTWYYSNVMGKVGAYNQSQNNGNGYNSGFPYFGEHTYSGSYIYYGFFGKFHK